MISLWYLSKTISVCNKFVWLSYYLRLREHSSFFINKRGGDIHTDRKIHKEGKQSNLLNPKLWG